MKFLDTLSLHVCVSGQTTAQKLLWNSSMRKKDDSPQDNIPLYEENCKLKN